MSVRLISYTIPAADLDFELDCTPETYLTDLVAYCARVSNPSNQTNTETAEKLVKYLIKHKHWSPLEMVNICLEIGTTRDISRQIIRHRSFCFQEFSQRYSNPTDAPVVVREARMQDNANRQSSLPCNDSGLDDWFTDAQREVRKLAEEKYITALKLGIAKEQARCLLPEGLTGTRLYMNGSLRSWIHYIELRTRPETQKEHREIAQECAKVISEIFPLISEFCYNEC